MATTPTLWTKTFKVEQCPCCHKGLSRVFDRGYGLRSVAPNWDRDSAGRIYINPDRPSLAVDFALEQRLIFTETLHLCRGTHLHFECDDYDERHRIKRLPSVTRLIENLLRDWNPARLLIGTGDHNAPHLLDGFELPRCWERERP